MAVIERERISRALQLSLEHGVAMLVAPAGFGKTEAATAAFAFARPLRPPDGEMTVATLARSLLALTETRNLVVLNQVLKNAAEDESEERYLAGWLARRLRVVTVPILVDDFHRINANRECRDLFARVVEATAPKLQWIIVARENPTLPIGTWIARDLMQMPLTGNDLRFTVADARELAHADAVTLTDEALESIVENSGGWALAVGLSVASWNRTLAVAPLRLRTNAMLFDFIEEQVWSGVSAADRELLVASALLLVADSRVLTRAGFAAAGEQLHAIAQRFPLLAEFEPGSYRLQPLFREFIIARHGEAGRTAGLIGRLLDGLVASDDVLNALRLAVSSSSWDVAQRLLEAHGYDLIERGESSAVMEALTALPRRPRETATVAALRGIIRFNEGAVGPTEADLQAALKGALSGALRRQVLIRLAQLAINRGDGAAALELLSDGFAGDDVDRLDALTLTAAARALSGDANGSREAIAQTAGSLDGLPTEVRARLVMRIAFALYYSADYAGAESRALVAAELATASSMPSLAARAYSVLQAVATMTHPDTIMAVRYAQNWLEFAREAAEKFGEAYALMALVFLAAVRADDELYEESVAGLREVRLALAPRQNIYLRWARVIHDAGNGRMREALLSTRSLDLSDADEAAKSFWTSIEGVLSAASGETDRARQALHRPIITTAVSDLQSRQYLAYAHSYRALGLWILGQGKLAQRTPWSAGSDLPETDMIQLAVMRSICMSPRKTMTVRKLELLTAPLVGMDLHGQARFIRALFKPAKSDGLLSELELDVLREFHRGGTYVEVADRMQIAPRTLEKRLQTACRKLACSGRNEAVAYALGRGWLD